MKYSSDVILVTHQEDMAKIVAGTIDEEVKRIIDECYLKARALIQEYHPVLEKCAQLLLEKEKITRSEFEALFADSEVEG